MKGFLRRIALLVALLAGCDGDEAPVEEYVQDPLSTAAETPDVTEPLGRPANDPLAAVESFILALKLGEREKLSDMIYPVVEGEGRAPLYDSVDELVAGPAITDWDEVTAGAELPVEGGVLEGREVSVRVYRGETSRVWRFTVVRSDAGWYLWALE
jgi:hypothetical protein